MSPRVKYNKSPLAEVIYQLRFPTILSINAKEPTDFQDKIRNEYPYYDEMIEEQNQIQINTNDNVAQIKQIKGLKNYVFLSQDRSFKINLTASFIAFSTVAYTQWEEFRDRIKSLVAIFEDIYQPAFYIRVGLRYVDIISKSQWSLEDRGWNELIKPHILGVVTKDREEGTTAYLTETEHHNLIDEYVQKSHIEFVHVNDAKEVSLLIDCDYFTNETTQLIDLWMKSEKLHDNSSNYIDNAITELLKEAMEPELIQ